MHPEARRDHPGAILTFFAWGFSGPSAAGESSWVHGLINAVAVPVVACPWALGQATGTDVTMNSAQVTWVQADLRCIAQARVISDETVANMKQNLALAFVCNAQGISLAAGVLFPFTGWLLSPMIAALAMSLRSVSVTGSALRLRHDRAEPAKTTAL